MNNKDKWITFICVLLFALGSVCIVLYKETDVFKKIIDFIVKIYNTMRNWFK